MVFQKLFLLFLILSMSSIAPRSLQANGASFSIGVKGGNLVIQNQRPIQALKVDEKVHIDTTAEKVFVEYTVVNTSAAAIEVNFAFPVSAMVVEGMENLCAALESPIANDSDSTATQNSATPLDALDFQVQLNTQKLKAQPQATASIELADEYQKLKQESCLLYLFKASFKPGKNILAIHYRFLPFLSLQDNLGETWHYRYPIWPAQNWVKVFGQAEWKITMPPSDQLGYLGFPNSLHRAMLTEIEQERAAIKSCANSDTPLYNEEEVKAPGQLQKQGQVYRFMAQNYEPKGFIEITKKQLNLLNKLANCQRDEKGKLDEACWSQALAQWIASRRYCGARRCYDFNDLDVHDFVGKYDGQVFGPNLAFFRNEIFARHGQSFKQVTYQKFFKKIPWYQPKAKPTPLNAIEKWNVQYLKELEMQFSQSKNAWGLSLSPSEKLLKARPKACFKFSQNY